MYIKRCLIALSLGFMLIGCAARPSSIAASYVSFEKYTDLDCVRLHTLLLDTKMSLTDYSAKQDQIANGDAVMVFFFGVPTSKLTGDHEGEIARLKGEVEAIDTAMIKKKCKDAGAPAPEPAAKIEAPKPQAEN